MSGVDRRPVTTWAELKTFDEDEMLAGYRDGFAGEPEPGDNRSKAHWHGWRNGHRDKFGDHWDPAADALIKEMRLNNAFDSWKPQ